MDKVIQLHKLNENVFIKPVYVQIFPVAVLDIEIKWAQCKIIWSIFIGRMKSVIKMSAGRGGRVHRGVGAGEGEGKAWQERCQKMMTSNRGRSHLATSRAARHLSVTPLFLAAKWHRDGCPILEGGSLIGKMDTCYFLCD